MKLTAQKGQMTNQLIFLTFNFQIQIRSKDFKFAQKNRNSIQSREIRSVNSRKFASKPRKYAQGIKNSIKDLKIRFKIKIH